MLVCRKASLTEIVSSYKYKIDCRCLEFQSIWPSGQWRGKVSCTANILTVKNTTFCGVMFPMYFRCRHGLFSVLKKIVIEPRSRDGARSENLGEQVVMRCAPAPWRHLLAYAPLASPIPAVTFCKGN